MVRCWKCGRENEEGMRFCTNCGSSLTTTQPSGAGGYDPSTSETISFNAPPQTAAGQRPPTRPYTAQPFAQSAQPQPQKSKTGLIVGVVVALLLLSVIAVGGIGAYYYYSNSTNVANNNNSNNSNRKGALDPDKKATPDANATPESQPSPTPSSKQTFDPPTTPTKEGSFTVYANEGWQLSEIAVVPLEEYTSTTDGIVDIAGVKTGLRATGIKDDKFKSRRLYAEFPVGALLMRTRYADGRFSNMVAAGTSGSWQNLPDERGMLEFIINDNQPQDNGGQFTIKVRLKSVPKKK